MTPERELAFLLAERSSLGQRLESAQQLAERIAEAGASGANLTPIWTTYPGSDNVVVTESQQLLNQSRQASPQPQRLESVDVLEAKIAKCDTLINTALSQVLGRIQGGRTEEEILEINHALEDLAKHVEHFNQDHTMATAVSHGSPAQQEVHNPDLSPGVDSALLMGAIAFATMTQKVIELADQASTAVPVLSTVVEVAKEDKETAARAEAGQEAAARTEAGQEAAARAQAAQEAAARARAAQEEQERDR